MRGGSLQPLTPQEMRLARLCDLTYEQMGERLGMNPRTVKGHVDRIRVKLGVKSKRQIQRVLRDMGLLT